MSNWSATQLTDKGRALDAKVTAGTASLNFTKMKLGSGTETVADIPAMTDLSAPELVLGISSCAVSQSDDTICELIAIASSENVQTSFIVRELGVFATDPDNGEILYAVMLDNNPDTMLNHNVASPVTVTYQVNIMSSNASSISAVIDPAGLVSVFKLNAAIGTHNTGSDSHADLLHLRKPSTEYAVGDIAYSALLPSWSYLECTVAGTTDSGDLPVPSSVVVNDTFTDGTVIWKIRKVGGSGVPVGTILPYAVNGSLPEDFLECDGGAVSRTLYADLFGAIGTTYGAGDGSTTFNLPEYTGGTFPEGSTTAGVAKSAGLPNIKGELTHSQGDTQPLVTSMWGSGTGAIHCDSIPWSYTGSPTSGSFMLPKNLQVDASRYNSIYSDSVTTVQPKSLTTRFIIKYQ